MDNQEVLRFDYKTGKKRVFPCHDFTKSWLFEEGEEDQACLAHYMACVGEKNGLSNNDLIHIFPIVLRILKDKSVWSGSEKQQRSPEEKKEILDDFQSKLISNQKDIDSELAAVVDEFFFDLL